MYSAYAAQIDLDSSIRLKNIKLLDQSIILAGIPLTSDNPGDSSLINRGHKDISRLEH